MGEGRTQRLGVGKGKERRLCCGPQLEVQIFPKASVGRTWLGGGYPRTHPCPPIRAPVPAASSSLVLLLHAKYLPALCSILGEQFSRCLLVAGTVLWSARNVPWLSPRVGLRSSPFRGLPKTPLMAAPWSLKQPIRPGDGALQTLWLGVKTS